MYQPAMSYGMMFTDMSSYNWTWTMWWENPMTWLSQKMQGMTLPILDKIPEQLNYFHCFSGFNLNLNHET